MREAEKNLNCNLIIYCGCEMISQSMGTSQLFRKLVNFNHQHPILDYFVVHLFDETVF